MKRTHGLPLLLCVLLVCPPVPAQTIGIEHEEAGGWRRTTAPYRAREVAPINLANSNRLENLLRAGKLYLSLQDTIALALENNLDIELQRYGPLLTDASLLRAKAGGLLRGVPTQVRSGPAGAPSQRGQSTGITQSAGAQAQAAGGADVGGAIVTQTGVAALNLDPIVSGFMRWGHFTNPQTNSFTTGNNTLINRQDLYNFNIQQSFLTGTTASLGLSTTTLSSNAFRNDLNPTTATSLDLRLTQRLLQGFGTAVNSRSIKVARNNREVSDLVFRQQVITTVSAIINLYWDLVSFNEEVVVRQKSVELNRKLLDDNKKQVEIGTLAPIEIVRAEAELANAEQELTIAETRVLQQETILKNALSRTGVASPSLAEARIVVTDRIRLPDTERIEPVQDLMALALQSRPELSQRRINIESSRINLVGQKSQLLPSLDVVAAFANNSLAGSINTLPPPPGSPPRVVPEFFVGGFGTAVGQVFRRNFPDYSVALQLSIPLRNRAAQADMAIDQLNIRQAQLQMQQLENQIRLDVQNALIALRQTRAAVEAARKTRSFREQTLDAEQKKYALGASTIFNVILTQRDVAQAQSAEVAALSDYSRAQVQFDAATGQTLLHNNVSIDEAFRGQVAAAPAVVPVQ